MQDKIVIIDGSSLLYRAFYAMPLLTDSQGRYTNAVYGFLNMLLKLYGELEPQYVAVAFDKGKHTFRNDLFDGYKATRKPAPVELTPQFALIREVLAVLGIHVLEMEGYEGDDIIGTVAKEMEQQGFAVDIVTGDRDALQLVTEGTTVHITKKGITTMWDVTPQNIVELYGFTAPQVIEMKALMGDSSDNIPGVPGIGEKTALKLITQYGSLTGVYEHLDEVSGKKLVEKLSNGKDNAFLSKDLATIRCDVPVSFTNDTFLPQPRMDEVTELFKSLGFKKLLPKFAAFDRFAALETMVPTAPLQLLTPDQLPPSALSGVAVAVEGSYKKAVPVPEVERLAFAVDEGVLVIPANQAHDYIETLPFATSVVTTDGKTLEKIVATSGGRVPVADVTLAAYLLDPTRTTYGLSYLSERFDCDFNENSDGEDQKLASAAQFVRQVWPKVQDALEKGKLMPLFHNIEVPLVHTLAVMEMNGFTVDTERLEEMQAAMSLEADKLEEQIYADAGETFNINSTKQLGTILFEKMGLPVIKKTKTGYSTDSAVLEELAEASPMIPRILQYRALKKLISTYLEGLEPLISDQTGRIHTSFNQMVTSTGRLSSSDPNLQNIPIRTEQGRQIRSLFVPGKGFDYIMAGDYSQIELRLLAHLSQDETMIDGFLKNQDIHRRTASEVFGVPLEQVTSEQRSHAKAVNFGIIYGISDFGLARNIKISRPQAKEYIDAYFARYGKIRGYLDSLIDEARKTGLATTMFGRIRNLPEINSKNFNRRSFAERTAMNTPIQGSAADIIKMAMNAVQDKLEKGHYLSRLLVQVHDELVLEVTAAEKDDIETMLRETMEHIVTLSVPLTVDVHYGKNWEEAK